MMLIASACSGIDAAQAACSGRQGTRWFWMHVVEGYSFSSM